LSRKGRPLEYRGGRLSAYGGPVQSKPLGFTGIPRPQGLWGHTQNFICLGESDCIIKT